MLSKQTFSIGNKEYVKHSKYGRDLVLEIVLRCWNTVLEKDPIRAFDNFFLIGGDSLTLLRVRARLEEDYGISLPIRSYFQFNTAAALADEIVRTCASDLESYLRSCEIAQYEPFPLTDLQYAYWIGRNAGVALGGLSAHGYLEIDYDNLDLSRLQFAINKVIARHDMLRAIVLPSGHQQVLKSVPHFVIPTVDLATETPEAAAAALDLTRNQLSHQVLDLSTWPSFEIRASLLGEGKTRIHISHDVIFCDAWSFRLIWIEISKVYKEVNLTLPKLSITFRDYVISEIDANLTALHRRAEIFWLQKVEQLPPPPPLPLIVDPVRSEGHRFTRYHSVLGKEAWLLFKESCAAHSVTPSVAVLSAFSDVLAAFSGQTDMTLALTVFNRPDIHPDIDSIVGDFTSMILLAINADKKSFSERAATVQDGLWEALDHRQVSGVRVLRMLAKSKGRDAATLPVVFTSAIGQQVARQGNGLLGKQAYSISQTPQIYFDHQIFEFDNELHFNWDVVLEFFPDGLISKMFESYKSWLVQLTDSKKWVGFHRGFTPAPDIALINQSNQTKSEVKFRRLEGLFLDSTQTNPNAVAIVCEDRTLSYVELKHLAEAIARDLAVANVTKGQVVGILANPGWQQIAAVLAILLVGASYLPLDRGHPLERVRNIADQAGAEVILVQPTHELELRSKLKGLRMMAIRENADINDNLESSRQVFESEELAYVIFTSGSTGKPKGVMVTHQSAVNTLLDINGRFAIDQDDRILGISSLAFDLSVYDIFGTFAAGAALVIPPTNDPASWAPFASKHGVTIWNSVPALFSAAYSKEEICSNDHLRLVMLSGDWIPLALAKQISACPNLTLVSLGGATEGAIWSIAKVVDTVHPSWNSVPYGKPLQNQSFAILDSFLEPCPIWVTGELFIGGTGVASGYIDDARRTAESFVPDPILGGRLYRTGDYGRWLPDGEIEFQGRRDHQVKINGFRIELGEIENAVVDYPDVAEAAVVVQVAKSGARQIVVFFVSCSSKVVDCQDLEAHLSLVLPSYMMPVSYHELAKLPLSANGKVDRKELSLRPTIVQVPRQSNEPLTSTQASMRQLWSRVLNVEILDIRRGFFDLGGDSLLIVVVQREIAKSYGVSLGIVDLFRHATIEKLSALVEQHLSSRIARVSDTGRKDREMRRPDLARVRAIRIESRSKS